MIYGPLIKIFFIGIVIILLVMFTGAYLGKKRMNQSNPPKKEYITLPNERPKTYGSGEEEVIGGRIGGDFGTSSEKSDDNNNQPKATQP